MVLWSWMVSLYSENLQISWENKKHLKIDRAEIKALEHVVKIRDSQIHSSELIANDNVTSNFIRLSKRSIPFLYPNEGLWSWAPHNVICYLKSHIVSPADKHHQESSFHLQGNFWDYLWFMAGSGHWKFLLTWTWSKPKDWNSWPPHPKEQL